MENKPVYALSGYAEWFWLMAKNWKDVENRDWALPMKIRVLLPVRIYLHASKKPASQEEKDFIFSNLTISQRQEFNYVDWAKYRMSVIGEITVTGQFFKGAVENPQSCFSMGGIYSAGDQKAEFENLRKTTPEYFSPWAFGKICFKVKDGILYAKPFPCKGALGFWPAPEIPSEVK